MKHFVLPLLTAALLLFSAPRAAAQAISVDAGYYAVLESLRAPEMATQSSLAHAFSLGAGFHYAKYHQWGFDAGAAWWMALANGVDDEDPSVPERYTEHAVIIPLAANYTFLKMGRTSNQMFVYFGPTIEVGILSRIQQEGVDPVDLYRSDQGQGRLNVWGGGGIGLSLAKTVLLKLGYQQSLLNYGRGTNSTISRSMYTLGASFTIGAGGRRRVDW